MYRLVGDRGEPIFDILSVFPCHKEMYVYHFLMYIHIGLERENYYSLKHIRKGFLPMACLGALWLCTENLSLG